MAATHERRGQAGCGSHCAHQRSDTAPGLRLILGLGFRRLENGSGRFPMRAGFPNGMPIFFARLNGCAQKTGYCGI
jgi:hypothetical protein